MALIQQSRLQVSPHSQQQVVVVARQSHRVLTVVPVAVHHPLRAAVLMLDRVAHQVKVPLAVSVAVFGQVYTLRVVAVAQQPKAGTAIPQTVVVAAQVHQHIHLGVRQQEPGTTSAAHIGMRVAARAVTAQDHPVVQQQTAVVVQRPQQPVAMEPQTRVAAEQVLAAQQAQIVPVLVDRAS